MNPYKRVAFHTLGCKLNFSETSSVARMFEEQGFARVELSDSPDVVVINTCSVTDNADKKCRQLVNKTLKHNPKAFIAVMGCYAQLKPEEIASIQGVDIVLGAADKFKLLEHLETFDKKNKTEIFHSEIKDVKEFIPGYSKGDRTRSFLKVQDGCDYFCSFCTIPLARGRSRSNSIAETLKVANEVAKTNVKEVVLTGVNIGDFGKGTNETFLDLIKELDKVEGIERFRISSIEPNLLNDEIIEFVANSKKFVPHFHIPLQSGSDTILEKMRRRYKSDLYKNRIEKIKELIPNCCIGVDVIVGFPGETEEEFLKTYNFLNELDISYLHVFPYSERDNTTAVRIQEDIVPMHLRSERSKMLHILSHKKKNHFYQKNKNTSHTVLWESDNNEGFLHGFTENYIKVKTPFSPSLCNTLQDISLEDFDAEQVYSVRIIEPVAI